jgi:hypothetical protein
MSNMKITTKSGTTYTFNGHFFRIKEKASGYEWSIKPWQWFAFDENDPAVEGGLLTILDDAKRLEPAPGLRLLVYGKDEWRISTKITKVSKGRWF